MWNSWTASAADAYAYVSQADLWLEGRQRVAMPIAGTAPWPNALETLTPFGYRPAPDRTAIVPVTPPGLSLAMAALGGLFGHCAKFWMAPVCGGLLVWAAFLVGRRVGSEWMALGAAWMVATSPVVLSMAKSTMSDVPAAACWALAIAAVLAGAERPESGRRRATAAGAFASLAILVRPNLAPLAVVLATWLSCQPAPTLRSRVARTAAFCAAVVPGAVAIAWFNTVLYGAATSSGYGSLEQLFSWTHVPTNARRYFGWLLATHTVLAPLGLLTLAAPVARFWPLPCGRRGAVLLALTCACACLLYLPYTPFDTWWFLRFLLPGWTGLGVGMSAFVLGVFGITGTTRRCGTAPQRVAGEPLPLPGYLLSSARPRC